MSFSRKVTEKQKLSIDKKVLLTIPEAAELSNIGESKISEALNKPGCPFVFKNGQRRLVKREAFVQYLTESDDM